MPGYHLNGIVDELGLVTARPQCGDEVVRHHLGPAAHERHLRRADGDPHGFCSSSSRVMRSSRSSISFSTASLKAR